MGLFFINNHLKMGGGGGCLNMFCIGMFLRHEECEVGLVYIQVNKVSFFFSASVL
jgi:hypothetical protein